MLPRWRAPCVHAGVLACALLVPSVARAQDVGNDEVTLKDGGSLRGIVISSEPGVGVQILEYGQKEPRTIPWDQVSDVVRDKFAPRPPPAAPEAPAVSVVTVPGGSIAVAAGASAAGAGAPPVRLHVESPVPVDVVTHGYDPATDSTVPKTLCVSPCDAYLHPELGQTLVVRGAHVTESRPFTLEGATGDQWL